MVCEHFSCAHLSQRLAARLINADGIEYENLLLNYHRPCPFATERPDPKKPRLTKHVYRPNHATMLLGDLARPPTAQQFLRLDVSLLGP